MAKTKDEQPQQTMEDYLLAQLNEEVILERWYATESSGRTRNDEAGGDCDQSHQLGDEPTEQREQSQTACRLSYAESRRRWADRPRATQRQAVIQI